MPSDQIAIKTSDQIAISCDHEVDLYGKRHKGKTMTSEEIQYIDFNGKSIPVNTDQAKQIAEFVGKNGMFNNLIEAMKESSSTTIARSSGETSKHNYQVRLNLTNLVVGDRRMGGMIWLQAKDQSEGDDTVLEQLNGQFPNAKVTRSNR